MRLLLVTGVTVLLAALAAAAATQALYVPPTGDTNPQWLTSDLLVFASERTGVASPHRRALVSVRADGSGERVVILEIAANVPLVAAPTRPVVAFGAFDGSAVSLALTGPEGGQPRLVVQGAQPVAWVGDSVRLVLWRPPDRLASVAADGTGLADYPAGLRGIPSPDGTRFAYVTGARSRIHVVRADGGGDTTLAAPGAANEEDPVWSPDGERLAFWRADAKLTQLVVERPGGARRAFRVPGALASGAIVWAPDGRTVLAEGQDGLVAVELASGRQHALRGVPFAVFSPDGRRIAWSAGGECRTRLGIYVAAVDGSGRRRVTNSCRVVGTPGPDVLQGEASQVLLGLDGDDELRAGSGTIVEGNTLYGGAGADRLAGGYGRDTLYGGPDDDMLTGGPSADVLDGGPGRDRISGEGGGDTIGARDGERDAISCGANAFGRSGRDVVHADRLDVVARDCEVVHRR